MSDRQVKVPPTQYVSNLDAGEHGILFYTSIEEMRNISADYKMNQPYLIGRSLLVIPIVNVRFVYVRN